MGQFLCLLVSKPGEPVAAMDKKRPRSFWAAAVFLIFTLNNDCYIAHGMPKVLVCHHQ